MSDDLQYCRAEDGSSEQREVAMLVDLLRAATANYITNAPDQRHAMALLMTALPIYAGATFANLMFIGEVTQQDTARMAKAVQTNFRSGVKVGLRKATRIAHETGFMGAPQ